MNKIIFWFTTHKMRNYWFDYAIRFLRKRGADIEYNNLESYINLFNFNLKICFKVYVNESSIVGYGDVNQYWVDELFENNFEEFFITFIKENIEEATDEKTRNENTRLNKVRT